uniref:Uncharacterized protein n=1 Tax=Amphimedon queenslandica TaxID=400682 RepID=A0A1X7SEY3_AMPQE
MYLSVSVSSEVTLVPWSIIKQNDEALTFSALFSKIQTGSFTTIPCSQDLEDALLETVYVGQSKDSFSTVEASHTVNSVCSMFGSFVKFVVTVDLLECGLQSKQLRLESEPSNGLPAFLKEKTRKDRLYNEIVKFLANNNVGWCDPEFGKPFICDLCNVLWYVDGHHEVLASRSCPIPSLFKSFVGFNKPELSKHRKRSISNMSKDKLVEYSTILQNYVVSSWIQQAEWSFLKEGLVTLVESLASYASYLSMRNKAMKLHHSSPEPSVSFSDAQSIKFMKSSSDISPLLTELDTAIKSSSYYTHIFVNDYTPDDKRRRYLFMRELDRGVSEPSVSIYLYSSL